MDLLTATKKNLTIIIMQLYTNTINIFYACARGKMLSAVLCHGGDRCLQLSITYLVSPGVSATFLDRWLFTCREPTALDLTYH